MEGLKLEIFNQVSMALRQKLHAWQKLNSCRTYSRFFSTKVNWNKIRPMILKRIEERAKDYPVRNMMPVAKDVVKDRARVIEGVKILLQDIPMKACRFCPEVYIGETGHLIRTCHGYKRTNKNQLHTWIDGTLNDIIVPIEAFHLHKMFQDVIKHDQRFDFDRIPAVLELCSQAGADIHTGDDVCTTSNELRLIAQETIEAWESLRSGVQRLLLVYPAKVCQYCSEVHIGPSGHKARLCGVFKYESWRGNHFWKKAEVDDLIPPKVVWRRRPQDPSVLLDTGRGFYGHAPAVVELCLQAGAMVPKKYFCMMKVNGLQPP